MHHQWEFSNNQFSRITMEWDENDLHRSFKLWGFTRTPVTSYGLLSDAIDVFAQLEETVDAIPYDFITEHCIGEISFVTFVPHYPDLITLLNLLAPTVTNLLHADLLNYQLEHEEQRRGQTAL